MYPNVSVLEMTLLSLLPFIFLEKSTTTLSYEKQMTLHFSVPTQQIPLAPLAPSQHEYTFALALPPPPIHFLCCWASRLSHSQLSSPESRSTDKEWFWWRVFWGIPSIRLSQGEPSLFAEHIHFVCWIERCDGGWGDGQGENGTSVMLREWICKLTGTARED